MDFNGMFKKIAPGMCRMSLNGVAINVNGEYKTYNVDTGMLTNCSNFVIDVGDDMFFAIPTTHVKRGDIILATNGPATVIDAEENEIKAFDYKRGLIVQIVPERHVFFGNTYFFTKIVSPFTSYTKGKGAGKKMMKMHIMSSMLKDGGDMSKAMVYGAMMGDGMNFGSMFTDMFDDNEDENEVEVDE